MRTLSIFVAACLTTGICCAQNQELGTIVDFIPKSRVHESPFQQDGFVAIVLQQTDENDIKPTFVAHSATEFVSRYQRIPHELQQNGVWLTLLDGQPYSPEEKAMLSDLKRLCAKHRIPLFIHTGRKDRGRKRFSSGAPKTSNQAMERTADRRTLYF